MGYINPDEPRDEAICRDIDAVITARQARGDVYDSNGNYTSGSTRHGHSRVSGRTPEYRSWVSMRERCRSPKNSQYHNYGGRGIKVCKRWLDFGNFLTDMGPRPKGTSLDRINNNGDYEPGNCRWATQMQQGRNTRVNRLFTINGHTRCLTEWALIAGTNPKTAFRRIKKGWEPIVAIFFPAMSRKIRRWDETWKTEGRRTAKIRAAVFQVIDQGDNGIPWAHGFSHPFSAVAEDAKERFAEAIVELCD